MKRAIALAWLGIIAIATSAHAAALKVGDVITPENAAMVTDLVSPGNMVLVRQGMRMKIAPTERLEWPPPYKTATEKYSPQVKLNAKGELENYVAGLPFPLLDSNDPQTATKVMWNFSFRPEYTDDADIRQVEVVSSRPGPSSGTTEHFTVGHFAFYNSQGRVEVPPMPTDPEATGAGIRYRFGAFPFLEPQELHGFGLIRERSVDPSVDDNAWYYSPATRRMRRVTATSLSDAMGPVAAGVFTGKSITYANNLDPDSYFGFMAKIEDYDYKLIGVKRMLACVHAENTPAKACEFDNGRTVCPERWELRQVYVIEATAKPRTWSQKIGGEYTTVPKRVLYIDSEGWFITASDQYDGEGKLWKTIATFNAYRDRPIPDAKTAIYPFSRMFQTALVDEDVQDGFSSVVYMPGHETEEHECWYINMGIVTKSFLDPHQLTMQAH